MVPVDGVGTNEGRASLTIAVRPVLRLELLFAVVELKDQAFREDLACVFDWDWMSEAAWQIEHLILHG